MTRLACYWAAALIAVLLLVFGYIKLGPWLLGAILFGIFTGWFGVKPDKKRDSQPPSQLK